MVYKFDSQGLTSSSAQKFRFKKIADDSDSSYFQFIIASTDGMPSLVRLQPSSQFMNHFSGLSTFTYGGYTFELTSFVASTSSASYIFSVTCPDDEYLAYTDDNAPFSSITLSVPVVSSSSSTSGAVTVDLSAVTSRLDSLFDSLNTDFVALNHSQSDLQNLLTDVSSIVNGVRSDVQNNHVSMLARVDSLDLQIPDDLNTQLANLSTSIQNIDLSNLNPASLFLDGSLNGNGSRYRDGQIVKVTGFLDSFKVVASTFCRTDTQIYTVIYKLLRDIGGGVYSELHYVPELLVFTQAEYDDSKAGA